MKNVNQSFDGNLQKVNLISWNANVQQQRELVSSLSKSHFTRVIKNTNCLNH